jgi:hypothetical protein
MPSIFNPVTGKAERASKQQKEAYDKYQRDEALKTLLGSQFGAPTITVALALVLGPIVAAFVAKQTGKTIQESDWRDFVNDFISDPKNLLSFTPFAGPLAAFDFVKSKI